MRPALLPAMLALVACAADPSEFWGEDPECIGPFSEQRHEIGTATRAEAFCRSFQGTSPNGSLTLSGDLHYAMECVCTSGGLAIDAQERDRTVLPRLGHADSLVLTGDGEISMPALRTAGSVLVQTSGSSRACEDQVLAGELGAAGQVRFVGAECGLAHFPALRVADSLRISSLNGAIPVDPDRELQVGELTLDGLDASVVDVTPCMDRVDRLGLSMIHGPGRATLPCVARVGQLELGPTSASTWDVTQDLVVEDTLRVFGSLAALEGPLTLGPDLRQIEVMLSSTRLDPDQVPRSLQTLTLTNSPAVVPDVARVEHVDALTIAELGEGTPVLPALVDAGTILLTSDWSNAAVLPALVEAEALTLLGSTARDLDDDFGALRRVGTLTIEECGDLSSLEGLHGLESVEVLRIVGNRSLDPRSIDALIEAIDEVGSLEISRNGR